jgi:hypothetical protein
MVWCGACDPEWYIGSTSPSSGQPSYFILCKVACLSDGQRQEETKQDPKIGMLRDNRSDAHYSHQCCGRTCLPPPTGVGATD